MMLKIFFIYCSKQFYKKVTIVIFKLLYSGVERINDLLKISELTCGRIRIMTQILKNMYQKNLEIKKRNNIIPL